MTTATRAHDRHDPELLTLPPRGKETDAIRTAAARYLSDEYNLYTRHYGKQNRSTASNEPVEIHATGWRVRNGVYDGNQRYTKGKFTLSSDSHEWLAQNEGYYGFFVYERHSDGILPLWSRLIPPATLEDFVLEDGFDQPSIEIPWSDVFPRTGVDL